MDNISLHSFADLGSCYYFLFLPSIYFLGYVGLCVCSLLSFIRDSCSFVLRNVMVLMDVHYFALTTSAVFKSSSFVKRSLLPSLDNPPQFTATNNYLCFVRLSIIFVYLVSIYDLLGWVWSSLFLDIWNFGFFGHIHFVLFYFSWNNISLFWHKQIYPWKISMFLFLYCGGHKLLLVTTQ